MHEFGIFTEKLFFAFTVYRYMMMTRKRKLHLSEEEVVYPAYDTIPTIPSSCIYWNVTRNFTAGWPSICANPPSGRNDSINSMMMTLHLSEEEVASKESAASIESDCGSSFAADNLI